MSIGITSNSHPLVITQDLAKKSISDLAWTADGKTLFIISVDGTILAMIFEVSELGYKISLEENEKELVRFGGGRKGAGIVEGTSSLLLEERSREGELRGAEGCLSALMGDITSQPAITNTNGVLADSNPSQLTNGSMPGSLHEQDKERTAEANEVHASKRWILMPRSSRNSSHVLPSPKMGKKG